MNDPLDDIIQSAGYNPDDFHLSLTADPHAIHSAVIQPNTVYAAIEEDNHTEDVSIEDAVIVDSEPTSPITPTTDNNDFTEEDWNNILSDVGFTEEDTNDPSIDSFDGFVFENVPVSEQEESTEVVETNTEEVGETSDEEEESNGTDITEEEADAIMENALAQSNPLPLNSPSLLVDESTSRFSGTEWYNEIQKANIIIAGQGGIGSNLSFQIARMHPASLLLYDDDSVEFANMSGQLFSREDVGRKKVSAMASMISKYTNTNNVFAISDKFNYSTSPGDIMMCGFDSMEAREMFFRSWVYHVSHKTAEEKKKCLFLDGRLSIDILQVFAITGDDEFNMERYEQEYLFPDREADATVCSLKQTTYLACMIASIMTNLFTNFIANLLTNII